MSSTPRDVDDAFELIAGQLTDLEAAIDRIDRALEAQGQLTSNITDHSRHLENQIAELRRESYDQANRIARMTP